jgi:hypothetical protein
MTAIAEGCGACQEVGASMSTSVRARSGDKELQDINLYGQTANMADIDTRKTVIGRYFTSSEAEHRANVCLIGDTLMRELFLGVDPIGKSVRIGNDEFTVVGEMDKIGSVLGQDQDNFVIVPLPVFLRIQRIHFSITQVGTLRSFTATWYYLDNSSTQRRISHRSEVADDSDEEEVRTHEVPQVATHELRADWTSPSWLAGSEHRNQRRAAPRFSRGVKSDAIDSRRISSAMTHPTFP